jgi:hypothetical protein
MGAYQLELLQLLWTFKIISKFASKFLNSFKGSYIAFSFKRNTMFLVILECHCSKYSNEYYNKEWWRDLLNRDRETLYPFSLKKKNCSRTQEIQSKIHCHVNLHSVLYESNWEQWQYRLKSRAWGVRWDVGGGRLILKEPWNIKQKTIFLRVRR